MKNSKTLIPWSSEFSHEVNCNISVITENIMKLMLMLKKICNYFITFRALTCYWKGERNCENFPFNVLLWPAFGLNIMCQASPTKWFSNTLSGFFWKFVSVSTTYFLYGSSPRFTSELGKYIVKWIQFVWKIIYWYGACSHTLTDKTNSEVINVLIFIAMYIQIYIQCK